MFGNSEDIRKETKNKPENEPCFGGFGGRFSYELFRSKNRKAKFAQMLPKIATFLLSCIFFGGLGVLAGMMVYHVVQGNFMFLPQMEESKVDKGAVTESGLSITDSLPPLSVTGDGTKMVSVTKEFSERYRIPMGVLIEELSPENTGYAAGMRAGDIIVMIDGDDVLGTEQLSRFADAVRTEDSIPVKIFRDGEYHDLTVKMK